jgi:hypothetical protein
MSNKKLSIPNPCGEVIKPNSFGEKQMYCDSCKKHVHDLSDSSDAEVIAFFEGQKEPVCAQFRNSQLHRLLKPDSHKKPKPLFELDIIMSPPREIEIQAFNAYEDQFKGQVVSDEDATPLQYVAVELHNTEIYSMTDANGYFSLPLPPESVNSFRVLVALHGYKARRLTIKNHPLNQNKIIRLKKGDFRLSGEALYHPIDFPERL